MRSLAFVLLGVLTAGCDTPAPPPPSEPVARPDTCGEDINSLPGSSWLWLDPNAADKPNPLARVKFEDVGGALHAKYTAKSLGDVYDYACTIQGKTGTCVETTDHAEAWCKAWASTHEGVCDPALVAAATGLPQADFDKVAAKVNADLKKLKPAEKELQRKADNSPNNKIRGKIQIAVDKGKCQLTLVDRYQTLVDGKVQEYENVLGTAKFAKATEEYIYESCKDVDSAWAPGPDDQHAAAQAAGTIKFSAILQKDQKGAAGCTYTADVYRDWVKSQSAVPAAEDKKFGPRWDVAVPLADAGRHAVYFDRYKECDGKKDRIGLTCAIVRVE